MMELSTIGREFLKGYEIKLYCRRNMSTLPNDCLNQRCRIVYVSEGFGLFRNGEQSQLVTAPAVICLNEREEVDIEEPNNIRLDILYFDPSCYDADLTFDKLHEKKDELGGEFQTFPVAKRLLHRGKESKHLFWQPDIPAHNTCG